MRGPLSFPGSQPLVITSVCPKALGVFKRKRERKGKTVKLCTVERAEYPYYNRNIVTQQLRGTSHEILVIFSSILQYKIILFWLSVPTVQVDFYQYPLMDLICNGAQMYFTLLKAPVKLHLRD